MIGGAGFAVCRAGGELMRMSDVWSAALRARLLKHVNDAGGWSYGIAEEGYSEPTALAALALATAGEAGDAVDRALQWLAGIQLADGAVPLSNRLDTPVWPTPLALLAWLRCGSQRAAQFADPIKRATAWLLDFRASTSAPSPIFDHDTTIVGWPWVVHNRAWIEPTACAVLALKAAGHTAHERVREGVRLLLDRVLPEGGWNYGNRRVFDSVLRPFPATTGISLAALAGEPVSTPIRQSLRYLVGELTAIRSPLSLGWGIIGLRAWKAPVTQADAWLGNCADRLLRAAPAPHYDALTLLAGAAECPLILTAEESP